MSSMTELGSRPIVCYDQDCGLCRGSVRLLVALRLVPQGHLAPFQSFEEELAGRLLEANVHNELAVLDPRTREVRSGVDGLLWAFEGSWAAPLLWLVRPAPVRAVLRVLYRLVAYNRRVLSPVRGGGLRCACDPDFHLGLRLAFVLLCVAVGLGAGWAGGLASPAAVLLGVLGGAALLRGGQARWDGLAHGSWVGSVALVASWGAARAGVPQPLAVGLGVLAVLGWQRRAALGLGSAWLVGLLALAGTLAWLTA